MPNNSLKRTGTRGEYIADGPPVAVRNVLGPPSLVGARTIEWMTRQIMEGRPKPGKAALKGAAYGPSVSVYMEF